VLNVGNLIVQLGTSLLNAAQETILEAQAEVAGQYTVARTNIIVAESMVRAAADKEPAEAKRIVAAAMVIIDDTEENLVGRIAALGFGVRQNVRELFTRVRAAAKMVIDTPGKLAEIAGTKIAIGVVAGVAGLGLVAWFLSRGARL
jgi:hypothetical protein